MRCLRDARDAEGLRVIRGVRANASARDPARDAPVQVGEAVQEVDEVERGVRLVVVPPRGEAAHPAPVAHPRVPVRALDVAQNFPWGRRGDVRT